MPHKQKGLMGSLFSSDETRLNIGAVAMLGTVILSALGLAVHLFWFQRDMPPNVKDLCKWALITGGSAYLGTKVETTVSQIKSKVKEKLDLPDLGGAGGGPPPEA